MKEFILFFFAMFFSLWLGVNLIAGMIQTLKFGSDNASTLTRFILMVITAILWALVYAL